MKNPAMLAFLLAAALLSSGCGKAWEPFGRAELSERVSVGTIRELRLGMSREEVVALLGEPLSEGPNHSGFYTLTFSKPVDVAGWYPMLWVHLRDGRVEQVFAKRYVEWGIDDRGVYSLNDGGRWESNEFERTFAKPAV
jgi:hypothetical protein